MLNRAIIILMAGIVLPYIGVWFASTFLLGIGSEPNFVPAQIASSFALLLSVGIYFLSKIESSSQLRMLCIFVALAYFVSGISILLIPGGDNIHHLLNLNLFLKTTIGVLVGVLVLRNCKVVNEKI